MAIFQIVDNNHRIYFDALGKDVTEIAKIDAPNGEVGNGSGGLRITTLVNGQTKVTTISPPDYYDVQPGDTLSQIAKLTGYSIEKLKQLNPSLSDSGPLVPGTHIVLSPASNANKDGLAKADIAQSARLG